MGQTPTGTWEHYLQVTDQDFQRAIDEDCQRAASVAEMDAVDSDTSQKWTQPVGDSERQQTTAKRNKPEDTELWRQLADSAAFCGESLMGDTGFEPVTSAV